MEAQLLLNKLLICFALNSRNLNIGGAKKPPLALWLMVAFLSN